MLGRTAVLFPRLPLDTQEVSESNRPLFGPSVAMRLLAAGVPLTLLIDLSAQEGPDSALISATERPDQAG